MDTFKRNRKTIIVLIVLDIFMAIGSNIADWDWLMSVDWYLMPFAPICSLYPLTLAIWFTIYYFKKKVPNWFTAFIFMGIISYGVMAYVYYPLYMQWDGIDARLIGNMVWVTIYAMQSFIIASELRILPFYQYIPIIGYFAFKDYADRYLGSFIDILRFDFPEDLKNFLFGVMIVVHISAFSIMAFVSYKNTVKQKSGLKPVPQEAESFV